MLNITDLSVLAMWTPGPMEVIILLAVVLIFFGPKRLPQLSRSIGRSITDFKRGLNDIQGEIEGAGKKKANRRRDEEEDDYDDYEDEDEDDEDVSPEPVGSAASEEDDEETAPPKRRRKAQTNS